MNPSDKVKEKIKETYRQLDDAIAAGNPRAVEFERALQSELKAAREHLDVQPLWSTTDTASAIEPIIQIAVKSRSEHFQLGRPMSTIAEGFKEANIAHDLSAAFRSAGYYVFPEFPFEGGSIDAVFIRGENVVVCEWKRCYAGSAWSISEQTQRMKRFDPNTELLKHGFGKKDYKARYLWVCDAWDTQTINWWHGRQSNIPTPCPFSDPIWQRNQHSFTGLRWDYTWLWTFTKPTSY